MKRILIFFICLVASGFSVEAGGYTLHLPAKMVISEVRTYNWRSATGWFEGQVTKIIVEKFDDTGHPESMELYYPSEIYKESILDDIANGDFPFNKLILMEKTVFTYEGDIIKKTTTDHEDNVIRQALVRQEGNRITENVMREDGSLFFKTVSILDSTGGVMELYHYNRKEELVYIKVFDYSQQGDMTTIRLYNPAGNDTISGDDNSLTDNGITYAAYITITYDSYDDKGNWLSRSEYYTYADVWQRPRDSVTRHIEYYIEGNTNEE